MASKYTTKHGESTKTLLAPQHKVHELFKVDDAKHNEAAVFRLLAHEASAFAGWTGEPNNKEVARPEDAIWPAEYPKDMAWLPCRCLCFAEPEPMQWMADASGLITMQFFVNSIGEGGKHPLWTFEGDQKTLMYEHVTTPLMLADADGPASVAAAGHMEEAKAQYLIKVLTFAFLGGGGWADDGCLMPGGLWTGAAKLRRFATESFPKDKKQLGSLHSALLRPAGSGYNAQGVAVLASGEINYLAEIFRHALTWISSHKSVRPKQQNEFAQLKQDLFGAPHGQQ